jgi:hypothetical protein
MFEQNKTAGGQATAPEASATLYEPKHPQDQSTIGTLRTTKKADAGRADALHATRDTRHEKAEQILICPAHS